MSFENFEKFRQIVLQDLSLQKELQETNEREAFISRVIEIGAERGFHFDGEDVLRALRESSRVWIERWL